MYFKYFVKIYGAILIPIAFLNTVITLAPVLTHNLKRTVESNTNDLNKNIIIILLQNLLLACIC